MDQVLCMLRTTTKLLCWASFLLLKLWLGDTILRSTSRQNKTADGKLGLIISHLENAENNTSESVCYKFKVSVECHVSV